MADSGSDTYDYVIVGGGTAGLILASRLTEDTANRVLVLEAGEDQTTDPRTNIPAMWPTLLDTPAAWSFKTTPQSGFDGREISFPQGRMLGGTSGLNGLAFAPPSKAVVDGWAKLGNPGWGWEDFSKSFQKAYTLTLPDGTKRGSGPLQVSLPAENDHAWPKIWEETLAGLGYQAHGDSHSGQAFGLVLVGDTIDPDSRTRSYSANAYLGPARDRKNLTLVTKAIVEKIEFSKSNPDNIVAESIKYTKDGQAKTAIASKEIILAAGALGSPKLLEMSGVGDASLLEKHGIEVVIDNPYVGENLQNHVLCGLSYQAKDSEWTLDALARQDPATVAAAMEAYSKKKGPFANTEANYAAQLPSSRIQQDGGRQGLEKLLDQHLSAGIDAHKSTSAFSEAHAEFLKSVLCSDSEPSATYVSFPGYIVLRPDGSFPPPPEGTGKYFSIALWASYPLSRGFVHITSASPQDAPEIDPKYLSHPLDIEILAQHLRYAQTIAAAEPLASHLQPVGKETSRATQPRSNDQEAAKEYLRKTAVGGHHFTGSCSMMSRELGGVVDPELRVYGCRNLRVCDASIVPLTSPANPQATVYGVAEHAAEIIRRGQ